MNILLYYSKMLRHILANPANLSLIATCLLLAGCGSTAVVQAAGSILDVALSTSGLIVKASNSKQAHEIPLRIHAGEQLNTSRDGRSLSLVIRVYSLRSTERLKGLTYEQLATSEGEKEALGDDLIAVRELILLPGKTHTVPFRSSPETTAIGVAGLFRAPHAGRWKLAFAPSASNEIVIGAHACALTTSSTTQILEPGSGSASSLVGVQCNR